MNNSTETISDYDTNMLKDYYIAKLKIVPKTYGGNNYISSDPSMSKISYTDEMKMSYALFSQVANTYNVYSLISTSYYMVTAYDYSDQNTNTDITSSLTVLLTHTKTKVLNLYPRSYEAFVAEAVMTAIGVSVSVFITVSTLGSASGGAIAMMALIKKVAVKVAINAIITNAGVSILDKLHYNQSTEDYVNYYNEPVEENNNQE